MTRNRWARGLTLLLLLLSANPVAAQTPVPAAEIDCATPKTSTESNWCSEQVLKTAETGMQAAYKVALQRAGTAGPLNTNQRKDWKRALQEAQRKWIAFRDADCGAPIGWEQYQGSGLGAAVLACKIAKTDAREKDLKARYGEK
jgi:uncharacterized protein YecT (DUF1311 family)